jgi:hypothetical protein
MQSLFKLIPVALIATVVGTVAGYSLQKLPAQAVKVCALPEGSHDKSAASIQRADQASAWAEAGMDSSWKRWPSVTDF